VPVSAVVGPNLVPGAGGAARAVVGLGGFGGSGGIALHTDVVVTGVVTGMTYALLGAALVLVFRASRVINVALGALGAFGALLFALLTWNLGVPFAVSLPLAVLVGGLVGAAVEALVVRRLFRAPRVVLLVATIGVAQVLALCSVSLPRIRDADAYPVIAVWRTTVFGVDLRAQDLTVLAVVPPVVFALGWWLERTRTGTAVRAAAENPDAARLAGIPVGSLSTLVWAVAGALAVLAAALVAPVVGQSVALTSVAFGPSLLLRALVAGLVGGFVSLPRTLVGGVVVGVLDAVVTSTYPTSPGVADLVMFALVLALLGARLAARSGGVLGAVLGIALGADAVSDVGAAGGAADTPGAGGYQLTPRVATLPAWTASVWWLRHLRGGLALLAVLLAGALPLVVTTSAPLFRLSTIACLGLVGLSVTVLLGWAGQLSLGQFGFAAVGAVATAVLTTTHGWPFPLAVLAATLLGVALSLVVGAGALRVRGLMLAVATLGFAVAARTWLFGQPWAQTEASASVVRLGGFPGDSARAYYLLCLAVLVVAAGAVAALRRGRVGRTLLAVRDNERAAAAMTISVARTRLHAFALAGGLAALGGAMYGGLLVRFTDGAFGPEESLTVVAMTVVGGLGTVSGAIAGPCWVVAVPLLFGDTAGARLAASGLGLLVLLLYLPGGFAGLAASARDRLVALAERRGHGPAPAAAAAPVQAESIQAAPVQAASVQAASVQAEPIQAALVQAESIQAEPIQAASVQAASVQAAPATDPAPVADQVALRVVDLTVRFGGRTALAGIQLDVRPGEIIGLIGANGAGKSTLLDVISGFRRPDSGTVLLGSPDRPLADLAGVPAHRRAIAGIGRTFQDARLFGDLTVRDCVLVAQEGSVRAGAGRRPRREAEDVLAFLGLGGLAETFVADLSTGTRRLCELAMMLALRPRLLLFDEPTAGVAQRDAEAFGPLIRAVRAELGATAIVVEHDVPLLASMSDRLACLSAGRVLRVGTPAEVIADPLVVEAYLGASAAAVHRSGTVPAPAPARSVAAATTVDAATSVTTSGPVGGAGSLGGAGPVGGAGYLGGAGPVGGAEALDPAVVVRGEGG
jgi:ABC-type branched-subunit amino acid transport system ATPase component/ABC-type branched-subunit amino acid transport system permease subunit